MDEWSRAVLRLQVRGGGGWVQCIFLHQRAAAHGRRSLSELLMTGRVKSVPSRVRLATHFGAWTGLHTQEDGTLQQLHDSWIVSPDAGCQSFTEVR